MKLAILFLLLPLIPIFCLPEEKEPPQPKVEEKIEVVGKVSLKRAQQSITIYSAEDLGIFGDAGLKTILNQTPGILVLNAGHPGQFAYVYSRGASVNQTLYLVDGVKLFDPSSALGENFSLISTQLIEKLEVVRGPLSNLYGSNAMGGVINLISRKSGSDFSLSEASHGSHEANAHVNKRFGAFNFSFNGSFLDYSDGQENDRFKNRGLSTGLDYETNRIKTGVHIFGIWANSGIPFYLGQPSPRRHYSQDGYLVSFPLSLNFGKDIRLESNASFHSNQYRFSDPDDIWNTSFVNGSHFFEWESKIFSKPFSHVDFTAGVDFSLQHVTNSDSSGSLLTGEKTNFFSVYSSLGVDLGRLLLSASLRLDKYKEQPLVLSPQLGLSQQITPWLKLRASYSKSFRAPTLPEMLNPYWGNAGLLPEKGKSLEIGSDLFLAHWLLSAAWFSSHYKDLIGFSPLTQKFVNINQARISGLELNLRLIWNDHFTFSSAYTYLHTLDMQYNRPLLRRPRHSVSFMSWYQYKKASLSLAMVYVGKRLDYNELLYSVGENSSFNTYDIGFTYLLLQRISLFIKISNAFNRHFEEILGYTAPLRRIQMGLKFRMN